MIISVVLNGILGFGILVATLFSMGEIEAALSSPTGYPYMEIFHFATNSNGVASAMVCHSILTFMRFLSPCIPV
jgi:hypothetical protein